MLAILTYHISTVVLLLILAVAAWTDLARHRVPNLLTLGGALLGLSLQTWALGMDGLLDGLGGLAIGLLILLPFYKLGGMGAGDIKLMAAAGTFLGWLNTLLAVGLSLGLGSLIGLTVLIARCGVTTILRRYAQTLKCLLTTGQWIYIPPESGEAAAARFPYAIAIAVGTTAALWWLDMLNRHMLNSLIAIIGGL